MIKACIFDLDGTIADTLESMAYVANEIMEKFSLKPQPTDNFRYYSGEGADMLIKRCLIVLNGLLLLSIPQTLNVWALFGISWLFVLILGSAPVSFIYNGILKLLTFILFKKEKQVQDEGLEEEYDEEDDYEIMRKRKKAIEELAATLEEETEDAGDPQELQDALEEENDSAEEFFDEEDFYVEEDMLTGKEDQKEKDV